MLFLAGRIIVTTKHSMKSTGTGVGVDGVEAANAATAGAKIGVLYAQIDLRYEESALGNRTFWPFYEDDNDEEPVRLLFEN